MPSNKVIYVDFLNARKANLHLVFGGNFCQLHKFLPTMSERSLIFGKVQVHFTRLETVLALGKQNATCERDFLMMTMINI
jgi:hypothetical protein